MQNVADGTAYAFSIRSQGAASAVQFGRHSDRSRAGFQDSPTGTRSPVSWRGKRM